MATAASGIRAKELRLASLVVVVEPRCVEVPCILRTCCVILMKHKQIVDIQCARAGSLPVRCPLYGTDVNSCVRADTAATVAGSAARVATAHMKQARNTARPQRRQRSMQETCGRSYLGYIGDIANKDGLVSPPLTFQERIRASETAQAYVVIAADNGDTWRGDVYSGESSDTKSILKNTSDDSCRRDCIGTHRNILNLLVPSHGGGHPI